MLHFKKTLTALCLCPTLLAAQDQPAAILVLDGSGSMWGQIDGTAKITIAQSVVQDLMTALPDDLDLGLTVYGHRRKGDCADIETLVFPGPGTRTAIASAVKGIKPKGKTPMADAVVAAAQALRHTETAATVILVSDGIETCVPDVCAVARTLEETGVDFTAHVVGFDVTDPQALAQFQCIADTTGGRFLSAANADELGQALTQVAAAPPAPEPPPGPGRVFFSARESYGNTQRAADVVWHILAEDGSMVMEATQTSSGDTHLPAGSYTIRALRLSDETTQEARIVLKADGRQEVSFTFAPLTPVASLTAPATAEAGSLVQITWTGPNDSQDYLDTAPVGQDNRTYLTYEYTAKGQPLALRMPAQPGQYEIRYVLAEGAQILARVPIEVVAASFGLDAPAQAAAGSTIAVGWRAPGHAEDYVTIVPTGAAPDSYLTYQYASSGNPMTVQVPSAAGQYELRYIVGQDTSVALSQPLSVTEISATLTPAATLMAGTDAQVDWTGPNYPGDYITFVPPGADDAAYLGYSDTSAGNPVTLPTPDTPGSYELRYVTIAGGLRVLSRLAVTVQ